MVISLLSNGKISTAEFSFVFLLLLTKTNKCKVELLNLHVRRELYYIIERIHEYKIEIIPGYYYYTSINTHLNMEDKKGIDDKDKDKDTDKRTDPAINPQGTDQQQPRPLPQSRKQSQQWIPPTSGNPDLDPHIRTNVDLREHNPLVPRGMIFDPSQLIDSQRNPDRHPHSPRNILPPGARYDPIGPPDPSSVGPGRSPRPGHEFAVPDPDHFQPPGMPSMKRLGKGGPPGPTGMGGPPGPFL